MTAKRTTRFVKAPVMAVLSLAACAVVLAAGIASAKYMEDGAVPNGTTGGWTQPADLVCIVGLHTDGTLDVAPGVTDSRDCIYYNTGLKVLNPVDVTAGTPSTCVGGSKAGALCLLNADCTGGGTCTANGTYNATSCTGTSPNTKGSLTWNSTSSKCYDAAPCLVPGFTAGTYAGVSYPANDGAKHAIATTICVDGSGNGLSLAGLDRTAQMCAEKGGTWEQTSATAPTGFPGTFPTAGFGGACVAYTRQFKGQDANGAPLPFGPKGTVATDAGYCYASMDWTAVFPVASCPSLKATASPYDAGAAYDWSVASSQCRYAKSIAGKLASALTKANGTTTAAGTFVDLSTLTTMGDCLAFGGTWNNWVGQAATVTAIAGGNTYKRPGWDYTTQAPDADVGCLHCHSSTVEYNGPAERQKDSYLKTGHKNMLRKVTAGQSWAGPDEVIYTHDTAGHSIDFSAATVGGGPLYFLFGDWMAPLPDAVGPNGDTPTYGCGSCHTAGFKDGTNPGVQSIGNTTIGYTPAQPQAPYSSAVTAGHKWDLEGIHCSRCHNATVAPISSAQIAASSFPTTAPTSGGMGALASGTGRTNLCFGCHQSIAKTWPSGASQNDPTLIPTGVNHGAAAGRDFNGHVLGNSFLNSVHAEYAGAQTGNGSITLNSLGKYDLTDPNGTTEYGSLFKGYTCWQGSTSNSPAKTRIDSSVTTEVACEVGQGEWKSGFCTKEIKTKSDCETLYGAGAWRADASGDLGTTQGTCTTCHDIHNSLFVTEQKELALRKKCEDCHVNNSTIGATDAAAPQVVPSNIRHLTGAGTPFDTTKYDSPCVVCHMATQAVANGNQTSLAAHVWRINTDPSYSTFPTTGQFYGGTCSVHTGAVQNAPYLPVVYLSDTSAANCTGATPAAGIWTAVTKDRNAQVSIDGTYSKAVWVDLDLACGQCHGGSLGSALPGVPYFTKAQLSAVANGIHDAAAVNYGVTFVTTIGSPNTLSVSAHSSVNCGSTNGVPNVCPAFTYDWNWGDGSVHGTTDPATHDYSVTGGGGSKTITLTVKLASSGGQVGSVSRTVYLTNPDLPPTAAATCTWSGNTWTMQVVDTSSDDGPDADTLPPDGNPKLQIIINWGDGSTQSIGAQGQTFNHTYIVPGTYTVTQRVIDSKLQTATNSCATQATPAYFTISGTVKNKLGTAGLPSAAVTLKRGTLVIKTVYTDVNGRFSAGALTAGTYTMTVVKSGYTFASPAGTIPVGPSNPMPGNPGELIMNATAP